MKTLEDIANLISLRNFLALSIDNLHMKLTREDIRNIQTRIQLFDKTIIENTLKLDVSKVGKEYREFSVASTEDVKDVAEKVINLNSTADAVNTIQKHIVKVRKPSVPEAEKEE